MHGSTELTRRPTWFEHMRRKLGALPAWVPTVLAFALTAAVLLPQLHSAMRGDDSHVTVDVAGQRATGGSLWTVLSDALDTTINSLGRPQPFGVIEGLTYAVVIPERLPYKLGIAALTFAAVFMLWTFLKLYRVPKSTLLIVSVAFALSLQFRTGHDPVLGYYSTPQVIMLVFFGGLSTYLRFLRDGGRRWYVATLVLVALLLGLYEANYPLVLAFSALHLGRDRERLRRWTWCLPILAMGAFMTLLSMHMHSVHADTQATGYETSLNLVSIVLTAARQAVSGLPDIYVLAGSGGVLLDPTKAEVFMAFWRAGLAALMTLLAFFLIRGERPLPTAPARRGGDETTTVAAASEDDAVPPQEGATQVALIGGVLMLGSGLLISLATQWQQTIGLGGGHLATLSCTLGFVMVVSAAWMQWGPSVSRHVPVVAGLAATVFVLVFASQYSNIRVVAAEQPQVEQRGLFNAGLDHGVLDGVRNGTTLYVSNRDLAGGFGNLLFYGGTIDFAVLVHTGERLDVRAYAADTAPCGTDRGPRFPYSDCSVPRGNVDFLAVRAFPDGGAVILAQDIPKTGVDKLGVPRLTVVAKGASATGRSPQLVGIRPDGTPWSSSQVRWSKEGLDGGWARYSARLPAGRRPLAQTVTDPRAKVDFTAAPSVGDSVRIFGTKQLLP